MAISCAAVNASSVMVKYIDYGNQEEVPTNALVTLPHQLAEYPAQAIHCCLWGVEPIVGTEWSSRASDQFCELAESSVLSMSVCGEGMIVVKSHVIARC